MNTMMATGYGRRFHVWVFVSIFVYSTANDMQNNEDYTHIENNSSDITTILSKSEKFLVYRNANKKECYVEQLTKQQSNDEQKSRTLYVENVKLNEADQVFTELGDEVHEFCKHFSILQLKEQPPLYKVGSRNNGHHRRRRRQAALKHGAPYRGQTQTQYISFDQDNKDDRGGVAEAVAEPEKSRATVSGRIGMGQAQSQSASGVSCDECTPQTGILQHGLNTQLPGSQTVTSQNGQIGTQKPIPEISNSVPGVLGSHSNVLPGQASLHPAHGLGQPTTNPQQPQGSPAYPGTFPQYSQNGGQFQPPVYVGSSIPGTATQLPQIVNQGQPVPYPVNPVPTNPDRTPFVHPSGTVFPLNSVYPGNEVREQRPASSIYPAGSMPSSPLPPNVQTAQIQPNSIYPGGSLSANTFTPNYVIAGQSQPASANFPGSIPYIPSNNQAASQVQPTSVYSARIPIIGTQYPQGSLSPVPPYTVFQPPQYFTSQPTGQALPTTDQSFTYSSALPPQTYYPISQQTANQPPHSGQQTPIYQYGYPQTQSSIPQPNIPQGYPQPGTIYQLANQGSPVQGSTAYQPTQSGGQQLTGSPDSERIVYDQQNIPINYIGQPQQLPYRFTGPYGNAQPQWTVNRPPSQVFSPVYPAQVFPQGNAMVPNYGGYSQPQEKNPSTSQGGSVPGNVAWFGIQVAPVGTNTQIVTGYTPQGGQPSNVGGYPYNQPQQGTYITRDGSAVPAYGGNSRPAPTSSGIPIPTNTGTAGSPGGSYQPGQGTYIIRDGSAVPTYSGPSGPAMVSGFPTPAITNIAGSPSGSPVGSPIPGGSPPEYGGHSGLVYSNYPTYSGVPGTPFAIPPGSPNTQKGLGGSLNHTGGEILGGGRGIDISQGMQIIPVDTEFGESQSLSGIHIHNTDTNAEASAQGKTRNGFAQAQVSGTYTGSFSAQAQTSDNEKSAKTQIFGNKTGAMSSSQGNAGRSQSQSQIQYNYGSGASMAESQGKGVNYATNVQIQAGHKGGLADAQASGPGSTNSQAQIGFVPYDENRNRQQQSVFEGGGTASSQSGALSGQSQTQFQGAFKSGPSFTGAAQSSSGSIAENTTKLSFNSSNLSLLKSEAANEEVSSNTTGKSGVIKSTVPLSNPSDLESTSASRHYKSSIGNEKAIKNTNDEKKYSDQKTAADTSSSIGTELEPTQSQDANIQSKAHDAFIYRNSVDRIKANTVFNSGDVIPGTNNYRVPAGLRGRVTSTAGDKTEAVAAPGGHAQTQTVVLKPGSGRVVEQNIKQDKLQDDANIGRKAGYDSYVTVTNSEIGELGKGDRKYGHTYYSKSSSCGYFTFTCSLIEGTSGRTKICRPGPPTYSDGTPC